MGIITGLVSSALSSLPPMEALSAELLLIQQDAAVAFEAVSSNRMVLYPVVMLLLYSIYHSLFSPLRYVRRNHEVGYISSEKQSLVDRANEVRCWKREIEGQQYEKDQIE